MVVGQVKVGYRTMPTSTALQWLQPEQTLAGTHPFLFSQCQAITIIILLMAHINVDDLEKRAS